ncbi:LysR family transcriptional regulator [Motilimonas pumila]|uniref:LysR family transcriptional regulator n=1 Tax=Motilimonas pumila TaxID=2303987 RepID=A0A418YCE7_9GAMM|nr:LysR family transcriptional regulator [Motilimonas pumila]RJG42206.1 LysR family transcriptional regulator [Motilimonas pumila]
MSLFQTLDLNHLKAFVAVYKTGSTQHAAVRLARSQSYISKVLMQLRQDLQDPLFVRTGKGLEPTSYAHSIAPKIERALEQLQQALAPDEFDPSRLNKVTLNIVSPLIPYVGKNIIQAVRQQTDAQIELRKWDYETQNHLLSADVDLAVHAMTERSQQFYQRKLISLTGTIIGNPSGEYVKMMINDFNEHQNWFQQIDPSLHPGIVVDNYALLDQLMDQHKTCVVSTGVTEDTKVAFDVAIICKASRRHEPKITWLSKIISPFIQELEF